MLNWFCQTQILVSMSKLEESNRIIACLHACNRSRSRTHRITGTMVINRIPRKSRGCSSRVVELNYLVANHIYRERYDNDTVLQPLKETGGGKVWCNIYPYYFLVHVTVLLEFTFAFFVSSYECRPHWVGPFNRSLISMYINLRSLISYFHDMSFSFVDIVHCCSLIKGCRQVFHEVNSIWSPFSILYPICELTLYLLNRLKNSHDYIWLRY